MLTRAVMFEGAMIAGIGLIIGLACGVAVGAILTDVVNPQAFHWRMKLEIPWLQVLERICTSGKSLAELVSERMRLFPCSGEINNRVPDGKGAIALVQRHYEKQAASIDFTDGLSMEFGDWRLNLRGSNTEPLIRLNVESRGSADLLQQKTGEVLDLLRTVGAVPADH
jgi:phosphomannomutase